MQARGLAATLGDDFSPLVDTAHQTARATVEDLHTWAEQGRLPEPGEAGWATVDAVGRAHPRANPAQVTEITLARQAALPPGHPEMRRPLLAQTAKALRSWGDAQAEALGVPQLQPWGESNRGIRALLGGRTEAIEHRNGGNGVGAAAFGHVPSAAWRKNEAGSITEGGSRYDAGVETWPVEEVTTGQRAMEPSSMEATKLQVQRSPESASFSANTGAATKSILPQTGAIGAPSSPEAYAAAERAYEAIRADTTDVAKIAKNTGIKPKNIQNVKDHVFYQEHLLDRYRDYSIPPIWSRFDASPEMADSWERLMNGTYTNIDIQLLKHETAEAWYMRRNGPSYLDAHTAADARYPSPY